MNSHGHNRVRHIHNRDSLSSDLIQFIERVLEAAAGDLQSNIFIFPDVHSEANPPQVEYGRIYGMIRRILYNDPYFAPVDDAVMQALARGPFPVVIWISSLALSPDVPQIFVTGVLAHELGHARQIENAEDIGDVLDSWECYEEFLTEKQQSLSYWERPHEIDAELFARKVIRQIHPEENVHEINNFYKDYEPVLHFESSGGFELLKYFGKVIRDGPPGFRQWVLAGPRTCKTELILSRLAPE